MRYEKPVYEPSSDRSRVATYKPFHHDFDPETGTRLTKGDGGQYPHHRGIFFRYSRISHGPDQKTTSGCWACKAPARQEHRSVINQVCFVVAGRPFTVLRLNRKENPGEARMSERDYARFGSYFEASTAAGQPLEVAYRWIVHPGEMDLGEAERIAADYHAFPSVEAARQD